VACARRLIVYMVHTKVLESHMEVIDTLIHSGRLISTDTDIEEMILVIE
jgi:hypothetical protein